MTRLAIRVLGSLSVWLDGEPVRLPTGRTRTVLAVLALYRGDPVPLHRLIDWCWGEAPPSAVTTQLHGLISALRRLLPRTAIETLGGAYTLVAEAAYVDLLAAESHIDAARAAARAGQPAEATAEYRAVLDLWRGRVFDGLESNYLAGQAVRLQRLRAAAVEEWARIEIDAGRLAEVLDELTLSMSADPLRESLCALLMQALYESGRQADALEVFRATRAALHDGLGLEPGQRLQELHRRVLAGQPVRPSAEPPESNPDPIAARHHRGMPAQRLAQLPADLADFSGRLRPVKNLVDLLSAESGPQPGAAAIALVTGAGGVGKTTLAVHVAHQVRARFPDGQIYVSLSAAGQQPTSPYQVTGRLLRDLGVDERAIPAEEEERAALYRSCLAERRILLVFDDARDAAQVRPLLPANQAAAVLVTSRHRMPGLTAAVRVELDVFEPGDAQRLFGRIVGPERAAAEPEAVGELLADCGFHPLALRIAASRLATRPAWTVRTMADRLRELTQRLDELAVEDQQVRATFEISYRTLTAGQSRAFRLLAVPDVDDISVGAAASLLGLDERAADALVEALADVNLLSPLRSGRYRYQDLLRLFARGKAEQVDPPGDRAAVLGRLLTWYQERGDAAVRTVDEVRDFLDQECRTVALTIAQCARLDAAECGRIAATLDQAGCRWVTAAIELFTELGGASAAAAYHIDPGHAYQRAGQSAPAVAAWTEALRYFETRLPPVSGAVAGP